MIPKIIHCFWAQGPKTKLAEKCLASWRKYAPGWEIVEWNLENWKDPPQEPPHEYVRLLRSGFPTSLGSDARFLVGAVEARKWAMVSDYVRMLVLKEFGGIYLDLDVELVKPVDELPDGEWVAGEWTANGGIWMNPGGGIALEKDSPVAAAMLERYAKLVFDPKREMMPWINEGLRDSRLRVLPPEVMSPIGVDGKVHRTERTVGIHWYAMGWASPKQKVLQWMNWHGLGWCVRGLVGFKHLLCRRTDEWVAADFWEEHCTECGAPSCYRECPRFERSEIGRCRRFDGGLVRLPSTGDGDAFSVSFRPWGKLEMDFHGRLATPCRFALLRRFDATVGPAFRLLARLSPRWIPYWRNPWGLYRSFRWRLVRWMSGRKGAPQVWRIRASATRPVNLVAAVATGSNVELKRYRLDVGTKAENREFVLPPTSGEALFRVFAAGDADCGVSVRFDSLGLSAEPVSRMPYVKCLAWDLDGTFWKGTLLEDGAEALVLNDEAVRLARELDRRGIVNSIVSRNDAEPVFAVLKKLGLEELFVFPQIGWGPKSEGLKRLAAEMNIGLDAIAFIDDREENRNEVRANAMTVRVFSEEELPELATRPEFNPSVSSESASRRLRYREEMLRRDAAAAFGGDAEAFLRASEMSEELLPVTGDAVARCRELVQRTNQLNLTGRRYGEDEFSKLLSESECWAVRVSDKYGDYGIVGFVAVRGDRLVECCFSCRVAEKGVERRVLERIAAGRKMTADIVVTPRNEKIRRIVGDWLKC